MRRILLVLSLAGLAALAASPALAQGTPTATVEVEDQSGDGATVTVPSAAIEGSDGWVAIHLDDGGMPLVPDTEGQALIEEGDNQNVTVTLDQPIDESQTLWAMIHTEDPADGNYTFPQTATEDMPEDPPVMADGEIVVMPFEYEVSASATSGSGTSAETVPDTGGPGVLLLAGGAALLLAGGAALFIRRARQA